MNHIMVTRKTRKAAVAGALLAATVAPLMMTATPAQASTTRGGCTVTPVAPKFAGYFNDHGVKMIRYQVKVSCDANRKAVVDWQGVEEDWSTWYPDYDDGIFSTTRKYPFAGAGTKWDSIDYPLPDTEDGAEEIYLKVRFVVRSGGVESARTDWERTPYVSFTN